MEALYSLTWFPAPAPWNLAGTFRELSPKQMALALRQPELWPGGPSVAYSADRIGGISGARFKEDSRFVPDGQTLDMRVQGIHTLVLEYVDDPRVDIAHLDQWWGQYAFAAWTSPWHQEEHGARPQGPRWTVLLPLTRPVSVDEGIELGRWARHPRHHTGVIDASCEQPARWVHAPAINPGGFHRHQRPGAALDPDVALAELHGWLETDRAHHAHEVLAGTHIEELDEALHRRHEDPRAHALVPWPWPQLDTLVQPLWPGRVVRLLGTSGAERTTLLLQVAMHAAEQGTPVLLVTPGSTRAEVAARLTGLRYGLPTAALLSGTTAVRPLGEHLATLHVWLPEPDGRTAAALLEHARATGEAHGDQAPLVLLDGVEGWDLDALTASLGPLTDQGTLGASWPGASVLLAVEREAEWTGDPELLLSSWRHLAEPAGEADLVLALSTEPQGQRRSVLAALRNRDGDRGLLQLGLTPTGLQVLPQ